jgi:hypothetical protein
MPDTHISDAMRAAVGRDMWRAVSYPVSESDIRRWAIAVYYPEPPPARFVDADVAAGTQWRGIVAPDEFNPFAWLTRSRSGADHQLNPDDLDGAERMLGVAGPGLGHQLNGGYETDYGVAMRPGDVVTAVRRLTGYWERDGRLGLMLFSTTDEIWTNQRDELVKQTKKTYIRY